MTKAPGTTNTYDKADELEKGTNFTYSYNEMGERTKTTPSVGPATSYGYDQAGNLTSVKRPKEGETAEINDSYAYNGMGARMSQTISGTTSYLTWDTADSLALILSDGENSYIYGPNQEPVEQISSKETPSYYHHDQLGSTRMLTSSTGEVTATFSYGPYGALEGSTGTQKTALGYAGQYTSIDTGLIDLRARVYDPVTGQFLSVDPAVMVTRAPYNYAGDDPLSMSDFSGLSSWNPFSASFWTEGNVISESPLNPLPYYEREIEAWENGCSYWQSVQYGLEGAGAATVLVAGAALPLADIPGGIAAADYWTEQFATRYPQLFRYVIERAAAVGTRPPAGAATLFYLRWIESHLLH